MAVNKTKRGGTDGPVDRLRRLLDAQRVAVLASHRDGQPYCSLVAFARSADTKSLLFATSLSTRKFANLLADPRAAMMIDDRERLDRSLTSVTGVTAMGRIEELPTRATSRLFKRYLAKHPYLEGFVNSPNCALLRIKVDKYVMVDRFQHVVEVTL